MSLIYRANVNLKVNADVNANANAHVHVNVECKCNGGAIQCNVMHVCMINLRIYIYGFMDLCNYVCIY